MVAGARTGELLERDAEERVAQQIQKTLQEAFPHVGPPEGKETWTEAAK